MLLSHYKTSGFYGAFIEFESKYILRSLTAQYQVKIKGESDWKYVRSLSLKNEDSNTLLFFDDNGIPTKVTDITFPTTETTFISVTCFFETETEYVIGNVNPNIQNRNSLNCYNQQQKSPGIFGFVDKNKIKEFDQPNDTELVLPQLQKSKIITFKNHLVELSLHERKQAYFKGFWFVSNFTGVSDFIVNFEKKLLIEIKSIGPSEIIPFMIKIIDKTNELTTSNQIMTSVLIEKILDLEEKLELLTNFLTDKGTI